MALANEAGFSPLQSPSNATLGTFFIPGGSTSPAIPRMKPWFPVCFVARLSAFSHTVPLPGMALANAFSTAAFKNQLTCYLSLSLPSWKPSFRPLPET